MSDDTLRERLAERAKVLALSKGEQAKIVDLLLPAVRDHVAAAVQAERERADTHFEWGIRNHDGYIGMHVTEASARQSYADMSDYMFPHQAVVRRAVTTIRGEWEAVTDA